jgi:hypothetical protein
MPLLPFPSDAHTVPVVPSATGLAGTADIGKLPCHLLPRVGLPLHCHKERLHSAVCSFALCQPSRTNSLHQPDIEAPKLHYKGSAYHSAGM